MSQALQELAGGLVAFADLHEDDADEVAQALLPVVLRAQADAVREAADLIADPLDRRALLDHANGLEAADG
jgi:hypothetical protein